MTEFKPGDRVKVEYEGVVMEGAGGTYADLVLVRSQNPIGGPVYLLPGSLTLLGPKEPTGVGAVVRDAKGLTFARHAAASSNDQILWVLLNSHTSWELHSWGEVCENGPVEVLYEGVQP